MAPSTWSVLLLTAPMLIGLAAAYPQRAYHDEADVQTPEKNVRHIDGLDVSQAQRQLEESVRRQVEDQVRQTGSGSASGQWSVSKVSSYGGEGGSSSGAPVRATISGDLLDGTGEGVIMTNCHNCRMRIRKVGSGSSLGAGQYSSGQQLATGSEQVVSGAREYSSGAGQYSSGARQYSSGAGQYSSGAGQYSSGAGQYSSGAGQYSSGAGQHSSGAGRYSSGGGQYPSSSGADHGVGGFQSVSSQSRYYSSSSRDGTYPDGGAQTSRYERPEPEPGKNSLVTTKQSWDFRDLGYGTQDLQQIIQRMEEDLRAGRYENGKTVTTVTTTTSENGGLPVTRHETFVKDGAMLPQVPSLPTLDGTTVIGRSEAEDLLQGFRDELRSGKTQAGKTVTTVVESSSVNGAAPVVRKKTYVRDGFDTAALNLDSASALGPIATDADRAPGSHSITKTTTSVWSSDGSGNPGRDLPQISLGAPRFPGPVDHLGGGNLLTNSQKTTRNVTTVSSYSTTGASGQDVRAVDSLGGGHLIRESGGYGAEAKGVRRVDSLGGGHLIRESGGYGGASSSYGAESSSLKETRRVDALGGGHLIRQSGYGSDLKGTRRVDALGGGHLIRDTDQTALPTAETMAVSQMPGYRTEDEAPVQGGISNSKYYNTFHSSYKSGGAGDAADGGRQTFGDTLGSSGSGSRSTSSSTYKKVVSYSSTGSADVLEELDGGHQSGPSRTSGSSSTLDVQRTQDIGGNLDFIHGEQHNGRIPEAASGSYFSSSSQQQQQQQQQQGSIGTQQGGKLTVSLADIGILPSTSQGTSQQASYGSSRHSTYESTGIGHDGNRQDGIGYDGGYGGSGKLTAHASRQYESVSGVPSSVPSGGASGYSWSSHSSYSSGTPSRVSSSYGDAARGASYREQRRAQGNGGPDCDGATIKI